MAGSGTYPPGRVAVLVLGRVEDDGGEEGTKGDGELVETDDQTTDIFWCTLRLVHGHETADGSDFGAKAFTLEQDLMAKIRIHTSKTGNHTPDNEGGPSGVELETHTQTEDGTGRDKTPLATNKITEREGKEGTKERPGRKNRDLVEV